MRTWTYGQVRAKVESDLDMEDQTFVPPDEMMGYAQEAISICEAEIHRLEVEDQYYKTKDTLTLVSGTAEYDLPDTIYATKFLKLVYSNGNYTYPIHKRRGTRQYEQIPEITSDEDYTYEITNDATDGFEMILYPTPAEDGAYVTRWFIREANEIEDEDSVIDVPQCGINFVIQFMKFRCLEKEGHPSLANAKVDLKTTRDLMVDTLSNQVPDGENMIEGDFSAYYEMA